ncbi:TRAP transporter permease [Natronolimnohabitans innermongolicus]|uniref:TRAP transporter 4TM/12TM fusion protein n=1 Tax=Natronolimnohabitans innermongolicus JCM 12255 TaxID=1227499 RepID=L9WXC4_9EURY|nr:TRAP transporter fused permease subunit [Natronolimnohabitans innermongolicus]ELY54052.1 TRAP transporter 4TM/12TM fusion protein [Natronolimnohabitans innermongolicus JCM 12255]
MSTDTDDADELTEDEQQELMEEVQRRRTHRGLAVAIVAAIAIAFSAFQIWIAARGRTFGATLPVVGEFELVALQQLQVNAIHVAFALVLAFLLFPTSRGDGFVARRLGRIEPAVRSRLGDEHPLTRATAIVARGFRWAFLDPDMNRIAPVDVLLAVLATMPAYYIATNFEEIRQISVQRFEGTQALHDVFPLLEPLVVGLAAVGVPIDEASAAFVLGVMGMLLVLEATRRSLGLLLASLVGLFIVYARWGYHIPRDSTIGALAIQPDTWDNIVYNLWYTVEAGVHSQPVSVSVRFIFIFILFGAFLEMSGAGRWFIDLAYSATGTREGGPAKASVVSSGFMGMLSGSSIANTVTTGAFTIPLMKRSGYSPEFSGAVESSSSSGGQMLPPVMGAAAFLIVEFTGTPYADVIIAATLPAIAFFFGMWVMVHFEAVRGGIGGLSRTQLPSIPAALRRGWFYLIPVVLLLYYLVVARLSINRAGWLTIVAVIALLAVIAAYDERTRLPLFATIAAVAILQAWSYATVGGGLADAIRAFAGLEAAGTGLAPSAAVSATLGDLALIATLVSVAFILLRPRAEAPLLEFDPAVDEAADRSADAIGRPSLSKNRAYRFGAFVLRSMDAGARTATTVVVAVAAAGVVPGVISVTGLGPNLAALISDVSGESMLVLLTLTGVASIIFGMGMPTTAMYIILIAMLEAPLVEAGVMVLAAHLFVLYWGLMADVTPPVAVAAFAGAGVAKADEMKTAVIAFTLSLNKVLVPFAFVFSPGILLFRQVDGEWSLIGWADVADLGYFVPDVVIPVVGMFLGVYALGVTIIGYQYARVGQVRRALYSVASIFLMVPEVPLLVVEAVLALFGIPSALTVFQVTFPLRLVGLAMLVGLSYENRTRAPEDVDERDDPDEPAAATPGDV